MRTTGIGPYQQSPAHIAWTSPPSSWAVTAGTLRHEIMPEFWKRHLAHCGGRHDVGEICTPISAIAEETGEMYAMHLELPDATRADVITLLRARLGDAADLAGRIRQAYWSMSSSKRCEMFEAFHDEIDECIDTLSRRIASLSGVADCSVRAAALEHSPGRYPLSIGTGEHHEKIVRPVLARFSRRVRADVDQAAELGDAETADALSDISRRLETQLVDCRRPALLTIVHGVNRFESCAFRAIETRWNKKLAIVRRNLPSRQSTVEGPDVRQEFARKVQARGLRQGAQETAGGTLPFAGLGPQRGRAGRHRAGGP